MNPALIDSTASRLGDFAADVRRDLALVPKQLQSKYLYDPLGSALFEAICHLPWYEITRAECRLLARHAPEIASWATGPTRIVELGCGSGEKLATLLESCGARASLHVHLVDISAKALDLSEQRLGQLQISPIGHRSTYEVGLRRAAATRKADESMLVVFLGSNIGNFDAPAAAEFLDEIRAALAPGDQLLLGVDLVKPEAQLLAAYNDPLGVTAAFNKNLLVRVNRELGGDFDLDGFAHRAVWNADESRIEMRLVSLRRQVATVRGAGLRVPFDAGEWIWTESSYKYTTASIGALLARARFEPADQWVDRDAGFALTLARAE